MKSSTKTFHLPEKIITFVLLLSSLMTFSFQNLPIGNPAEKDEKSTAITPAIRPFFVQNDGQIPEDVKFYVKGNKHSLFLKENGEAITRSIYKNKEKSPLITETAHADTVREVGFSQSFLGANKNILPKAGQRATPTLNFFTDKIHKSNVPTYENLTYKNLYDGIDLTYKISAENKVKYDLIVNPGADPQKIVMQFDGVQDLNVDKNGNLVMKTPVETFSQNKPYIYQVASNTKRHEITGSYKVDKITNTVSFTLGAYDNDLPLIIDPVLDQLGASTFYGGSGDDYATDLVRNSSDQIYVTGYTTDSTTDLPVIGGAYDNTHNGSTDVFVARFDNSLGSLTYATYIGGSDVDYGDDIALNSSGKVVITGRGGSGYPTTVAPYSSTSGTDVFVSRLSSTLSDLEVSARFGGIGEDYADNLYVDNSDNIYIFGGTTSTSFAGTSGKYQSTYGGGDHDAFVSKLPNDMSSIESTFLGGSGDDMPWLQGFGLVVDSSGNIYVGALTSSTNFPTTEGAYDTTYSVGTDGFISKLSSNLTSLSASTYLGSSGNDTVADLALDSSGALYVLMTTSSNSLGTTNGVLQTAASYGYIAKIPSSLASLSIGTYFGGSGVNIEPFAMVLDSSNNVYVAGQATGTGFSTTAGAYDTSYNGGTDDGFVSKITANLTTLSESTYIGGAGVDAVLDITLNADETNVFIGGYVDSSSTDFPTTVGAYDTGHNGGKDGFISILGSLAGGGQGGGGAPEFSTTIYLLTIFWCGYLLRRKLKLTGHLA